VIGNKNVEKLKNVLISGLNEEISLEAMVVDFPRHFKLHLDEINELINKESRIKVYKTILALSFGIICKNMDNTR
jgi:hypothetical protein